MVAVRGPVLDRDTSVALCPHLDDRIQKPPDLADDPLQFANVRVREITLVRGGLHLLNRQGGHRDPAATVGFPIDGQHLPAVLLNRSVQVGDVSRWRRRRKLRGRQASRGSGLQTAALGLTSPSQTTSL